MSPRSLLLGACVVALLGAVVVLSRSSSSNAATATPTVTAEPRTATIATAPTPAPALPVRRIDPSLATDLADHDPKVRRAAISEAIRERDADIATLLEMSRDRDMEVGGTAMMALNTAYAEGRLAASELVARANDASLDVKVRSLAVNGLGLVASAESTAFLVELSRSSAVADRASAAILLQHQDLAAAVPVLIAMLADADAHVRTCAHDSLVARSRGRDFGQDAAAWQTWWQSRR